ncbi:antitoxin [Saccharopolyspora sp. CA-218241]|uniref:antitoxin n=1 Tax=Saccharopolyspora sp. CA-218241 TaxID=3240027 RepID=UPI003D95E8CC
MGLFDKAKDLANQAMDKAGPGASKGLDAAKTRLDEATGGKYHDKIENVSGKVEKAINRDDKGGGTEGPGPDQPNRPS